MTPELFSHHNGLGKVLPVAFFMIRAVIIPAN